MSDMTTAQHEREGFVRCGTLGHSWFDYDSDWKPMYGVPLTVRCERCGSERRDALDSHGNLIPGGRHYKYPPGYRYAKGERPSRAEFRQMLLSLRVKEARARAAQRQRTA